MIYYYIIYNGGDWIAITKLVDVFCSWKNVVKKNGIIKITNTKAWNKSDPSCKYYYQSLKNIELK